MGNHEARSRRPIVFESRASLFSPRSGAILDAAGVRELLGGATPSCGVDKKEDATGAVLEAVAFAPFVGPQNVGGAVRLVVGVPTHPGFGRSAFEGERQKGNTVGTSQDEPALGAAAFSTASSKGHVLKIVALKDETFVKLEFRIPVGDPGRVRGFAARVLANF